MFPTSGSESITWHLSLPSTFKVYVFFSVDEILAFLELCAFFVTAIFGALCVFRYCKWWRQIPLFFLGSTTPELSLTNLQPNENVGPYVFLLTVFDTSNQNDSAKVAIMVNKAINHVPGNLVYIFVFFMIGKVLP